MGEDRYPYLEILILNTEYKVILTFGKAEGFLDVLDNWHHPTNSDFNFDSRGLTVWTAGCHPVIWLPWYPQTPEALGTLAHEATHAIEDIFRKINEPLGGEIFAHSIGAVVRYTLTHGKQLIKDIRKYGERESNKSEGSGDGSDGTTERV